jgi:hypothetical protein
MYLSVFCVWSSVEMFSLVFDFLKKWNALKINSSSQFQHWTTHILASFGCYWRNSSYMFYFRRLWFLLWQPVHHWLAGVVIVSQNPWFLVVGFYLLATSWVSAVFLACGLTYCAVVMYFKYLYFSQLDDKVPVIVRWWLWFAGTTSFHCLVHATKCWSVRIEIRVELCSHCSVIFCSF